MGKTRTTFIKDLEDTKSLVKANKYYNDKSGGRNIASFNNPIPKESFYVMIQAVSLKSIVPRLFNMDGNGDRCQYMIKAYQSKEMISSSNNGI